MAEAAAAMRVMLIYCPAPREVREQALELPCGATVRDALQASGWATELLQASGAEGFSVGVWGRQAPLNQALREADRVEIYRPLVVDPKVARRERFRRQGTRAAGLFAKKKPPSTGGSA